MKILACGDIHNSKDNFSIICQKHKDSDLIILNGDITQFGTIGDFQQIIRNLEQDKLFINWGNCDTQDVIDKIKESSYNLDSSGYILKNSNIGIFGLSGSNRTPFGTFAEYSEEDIYKRLVKGYNHISEAGIKILFSHPPPYKTKLDRTFFGSHAGSRSVRRFLEEYAIDLGIFSHIHEAWGKDIINSIPIYNIGAVKNKRFSIISSVDNGIKVELLSL